MNIPRVLIDIHNLDRDHIRILFNLRAFDARPLIIRINRQPLVGSLYARANYAARLLLENYYGQSRCDISESIIEN